MYAAGKSLDQQLVRGVQLWATVVVMSIVVMIDTTPTKQTSRAQILVSIVFIIIVAELVSKSFTGRAVPVR
jgi:hypothetical protein